MKEYINNGLIELHKMATQIIEVRSKEELSRLIALNDSVIVKSGYETLVPNGKSGCHGCDVIKPIYESLATKKPEVLFATINIKRGNILQAERVPCFHLYKKGRLVAVEATSSENRLNQLLEKIVIEKNVATVSEDSIMSPQRANMLLPLFFGANDLSQDNSTANIRTVFVMDELETLCKKYNKDIKTNKNIPFILVNARDYEPDVNKDICVAIFLTKGGVTDGDKTTIYQQGEYCQLAPNQKVSGGVLIKTIV